MYFVYIIYSAKLDRYYVGYSENIEIRVEQHNHGISDYTSKAQDWIVRYTEPYKERTDAHKKELEIKRKKSRKYIEWLITTKK